ncbi:unnamed protein product [Schistocephalus solidus]|uniref:Seryl-tRNA synthetase n=1 Tax=Schistocephalus solidus TaxID=70667 RepID=A0A3P7D778_SCHSO|nr:unnamed protein product [Schistocephalus solidus]
MNGSPKPTDYPPKNAVALLSNEILSNPRARRRLRGLGLLRCHNMVPGCGHRSYNFYGSLALLETALVTFVLDRVIGTGMQQISVPDILPASAIESCGFPTSGERTQTFTIDDSTAGSRRFCLSGTAEMGIASYCAGRIFGPKSPAEYFCAVSRCYRREVPNQESLLYRTHQFTKARSTLYSFPQPSIAACRLVGIQRDNFPRLCHDGEGISEDKGEGGTDGWRTTGCRLDLILVDGEDIGGGPLQIANDKGVEMFCVSEPTMKASEDAFDKILNLQQSIFADLGLHYRVLEMPTSELGNPAFRKVDIEAFMPGDGSFGELNGTGCAVTRVIKALVETHQRKDGTVGLPQALWPYMNNAKELEPDESQVVFS